MDLVVFLFLAIGIFILSIRQFQKRPLLPFLDSLRHGKHAYLVAGIFAGIFIPEFEDQYRAFDAVRYGVLNIGLMWLGLQLGLECSLRHLRQASWQMIGGQIASASLIGGFGILSILASGSILFRHLGLLDFLPLATILCAAFVLTSRYPEPTFNWQKNLAPPTLDPTPTIPIHNMLALLVVALCVPIFSSERNIVLGAFSFDSGVSLLTLLSGVGIMGGICLDFALRAHRKQRSGMALAFGIMTFFSGIGHTLNLPTLALGFIAGAWLTNTTVAKRGLLEALADVNHVLLPVFYIFVGTLIGGYGGGTFFHWPPLLPLIVMVLIVRTMGRILGYSVSQYIWGTPETWRNTLELSARPLGNLSVALAIQTLFLLPLGHNTLIAGLLGAVVLSQVILFPPQQNRARLPALQKD